MTETQTGAGDARDWAESLGRRIEELDALLDRLGALGDGQGELIADERTDELLALLAQRESLVEQVVRASEQVDALRRRWDEMSSGLDESTLAPLRQKLDELTASAGRIAARDERDRSELVVKRDELSKRLAGVGVGRRAMNAYSDPNAGSTPRFQDRKG